MTRFAARVTDPTMHLATPLGVGPGSPNVLIGMLPAWRGLPAAAAAALQAAKQVSDTAVQTAEAATVAAAGTPGLPAAKAAEETAKGAASAAMSSAIASAASASATPSGGTPDIHTCPVPMMIIPHGPGVVIDGSQVVLVNGLPACRRNDTILEALGPPNKIMMGLPTVWIGDSAGSASASGSKLVLTPGSSQQEVGKPDKLADATNAAKTPIPNVPAGFKPTVDDGTKRALSAFPHTEGGKIARDLGGKTMDEVKQYMDANYPGALKSIDPLVPPPGQAAQVVQTKWELPDGTVVRLKETVPPGFKVDKFRGEPALSIAALKRDAAGAVMPESYQNEAFKIASANGLPVPKGPNDIDVAGLTPAQAKQRVDALMNAGHQAIQRVK